MQTIQRINCDKCNRYLFTETFEADEKYERENDIGDYTYFDKEDIFVCNRCLKNDENRITCKK